LALNRLDLRFTGILAVPAEITVLDDSKKRGEDATVCTLLLFEDGMNLST
jgi:hypothetical protein